MLLSNLVSLKDQDCIDTKQLIFFLCYSAPISVKLGKVNITNKEKYYFYIVVPEKYLVSKPLLSSLDE